MNILEMDSNTGNPGLQSEKVYHAIIGGDYSDPDYMFRIEGIYLQKKPKKGDWLSG